MVDLREIVAEMLPRAKEAERARRCVQAGTMATAWYRADGRYRQHAFARHVSALCDRWVDAFVRAEPLFLSLHAPPGHGKSEHVGRAMPIRAMALRPGGSLVYVTSTEDRAIEVSLAVRGAFDRLSGCGAYPHLAKHPSGPWGQTQFRTAGGGWWTALAPGMATGGVDAHGLVFDDVTGSARKQRSRAERLSIRRFLEEDALSRLRGVGPRMNMETRRGLDDSTAYLKEQFGDQMEMHEYRHVADADDIMGRQPGEYLWPDLYGPAWHAANPHLVPGSAIWEALHQQRPVREGGAVILDAWCSHRYQLDPAAQARVCRQIVIAVDPAAKTAERNDPTGIVVAGLFATGSVDVLHAEAVRRDSPDTEQRIADLVAEYRAAGVPVTVAIEDTSVGQAWIPTLRRRGLTVVAVSVAGRGDKVQRMHPHLGRWASGMVRLPTAAPWVAAFVAQIVSVPDAEHDDLWDAMSILLWYVESMNTRTPQPVRALNLRSV